MRKRIVGAWNCASALFQRGIALSQRPPTKARSPSSAIARARERSGLDWASARDGTHTQSANESGRAKRARRCVMETRVKNQRPSGGRTRGEDLLDAAADAGGAAEDSEAAGFPADPVSLGGADWSPVVCGRASTPGVLGCAARAPRVLGGAGCVVEPEDALVPRIGASPADCADGCGSRSVADGSVAEGRGAVGVVAAIEGLRGVGRRSPHFARSPSPSPI